MSKVHDITKYKPSFNEGFFLDNNILVFIYCPIGNYEKAKQKQYSAFLKELKDRNSTIYINSLVLSEFANVFLRIDFRLWKKESGIPKLDYKKDFVGSDRFKDTVKDVKIAIKQILKISEKTSDDFHAINLENVFNEFGNADFNDSYYIEQARFKNWKIVTDDADFQTANYENLEVITANENIIE